ncbi:MAG: caspase family protein, partial [Bacteroidota bacterium]
QQRIDRFPPPSVKLALNLASDQLTTSVLVKSVDQGGGFENLRLYHNGKRILAEEVMNNTVEKRDGEWYTKLKVPLVAGRNVFGAVAISSGKTESALTEEQVFSQQKASSAVCHVLAIGINDYQNNSMDLGYARADAVAVAEVIQQDQQLLFKEIKVRMLLDTDATKSNILAALDEMAEAVGLNDLFLFYYAGHGSVVDNQFFFIPTETPRLFDIKSLKKTAIEAGAIQEKLKSIKALKQVIIMDACQSGGSVALLAQRGSVQEKAIAQLSRSAGIHVLASAGSDQYATEFDQLGHGLFTHVLLKALGGAADGAPKEGKVTLFELKSYLDDQVPELSMQYKGRPQYPYTFSRGNDFPLSVKKE